LLDAAAIHGSEQPRHRAVQIGLDVPSFSRAGMAWAAMGSGKAWVWKSI
jgi:hypothetical protein